MRGVDHDRPIVEALLVEFEGVGVVLRQILVDNLVDSLWEKELSVVLVRADPLHPLLCCETRKLGPFGGIRRVGYLAYRSVVAAEILASKFEVVVPVRPVS